MKSVPAPAAEMTDTDGGPHFVRLSAQPLQRFSRRRQIRRFTDYLAPKRYKGVGSQNHRVREKTRDLERLASGVPDRPLANGQAAARRFGNGRRHHFEIETRFGKQVSPARRTGGENETRGHATCRKPALTGFLRGQATASRRSFPRDSAFSSLGNPRESKNPLRSKRPA